MNRTVFLPPTKVASFADTHGEIVMNESSHMYVFDSRYLWNNGVRKGKLKGDAAHQLTCKEPGVQEGLEAELPVITEVDE